MTRRLPSRPSLEHLKCQAKDLLKAHRRGDPSACKTLRLLHRFAKASDEEILSADLALHEAQYALAMDYGFESWSALKKRVEETAPPIRDDPPKRWYHGSPVRLDTLAAGSTDWWRVVIEHDGRQDGFLYEVEVADPEADLRPHPESTMAPGDEMLTTRELMVRLMEELPAQHASRQEFTEGLRMNGNADGTSTDELWQDVSDATRRALHEVFLSRDRIEIAEGKINGEPVRPEVYAAVLERIKVIAYLMGDSFKPGATSQVLLKFAGVERDFDVEVTSANGLLLTLRGRATAMHPREPFDVVVYGNDDALPAEAEEMFRDQLADSRSELPDDRADKGQWRFACVCAVTPTGRVLGGVHMDMGPVNFGPLADEKLAYVESVFIRPEYRRQGIATQLLDRAAASAKEAGCLHMRCNVRWDNPAELALFRKCGFALTDVSDEDEGGEYFTVKPL